MISNLINHKISIFSIKRQHFSSKLRPSLGIYPINRLPKRLRGSPSALISVPSYSRPRASRPTSQIHKSQSIDALRDEKVYFLVGNREPKQRSTKRKISKFIAIFSQKKGEKNSYLWYGMARHLYKQTVAASKEKHEEFSSVRGQTEPHLLIELHGVNLKQYENKSICSDSSDTYTYIRILFIFVPRTKHAEKENPRLSLERVLPSIFKILKSL